MPQQLFWCLTVKFQAGSVEPMTSYRVLNVVVSEKCFKGLPLKFYFRPFGDIRSNRKWNLKSAVNRKRQPEIVLYTLGCREPAWNLGGQFFETWLLSSWIHAWSRSFSVPDTSEASDIVRKRTNKIPDDRIIPSKTTPNYFQIVLLYWYLEKQEGPLFYDVKISSTEGWLFHVVIWVVVMKASNNGN